MNIKQDQHSSKSFRNIAGLAILEDQVKYFTLKYDGQEVAHLEKEYSANFKKLLQAIELQTAIYERNGEIVNDEYHRLKASVGELLEQEIDQRVRKGHDISDAR